MNRMSERETVVELPLRLAPPLRSARLGRGWRQLLQLRGQRLLRLLRRPARAWGLPHP
jgi:hypothetical protein